MTTTDRCRIHDRSGCTDLRCRKTGRVDSDIYDPTADIITNSVIAAAVINDAISSSYTSSSCDTGGGSYDSGSSSGDCGSF